MRGFNQKLEISVILTFHASNTKGKWKPADAKGYVKPGETAHMNTEYCGLEEKWGEVNVYIEIKKNTILLMFKHRSNKEK